MEHLIQFGVTIDEEAIVREATSNAAKAIEKQAEDEIRKVTYNKWGGSQLEIMFENKIAEVCEENKDLIIEKAIEVVASRITKGKAYREAVSKANFTGEVK